MNLIYKNLFFPVLLALTLLLISCKEEDAMVVDRVVAPVLVLVDNPSFSANDPVIVTATIYELDKKGILDHTVGIDSIPVAHLTIKVFANNIEVGAMTTDASGRVTINKSWEELGYASPRPGNAASLAWSGSHKGQAFTKLSRVQVK